MSGKSFQFVAKVVLMNRQNKSTVFNFIIFSSSVKKKKNKFPSMRFLISSVYIYTRSKMFLYMKLVLLPWQLRKGKAFSFY